MRKKKKKKKESRWRGCLGVDRVHTCGRTRSLVEVFSRSYRWLEANARAFALTHNTRRRNKTRHNERVKHGIGHHDVPWSWHDARPYSDCSLFRFSFFSIRASLAFLTFNGPDKTLPTFIVFFFLLFSFFFLSYDLLWKNEKSNAWFVRSLHLIRAIFKGTLLKFYFHLFLFYFFFSIFILPFQSYEICILIFKYSDRKFSKSYFLEFL